ncbi:hypothetical protein SDC9_85898 [bioreactor metagenome]|uniref:Uncharacterized protein n=1 Tax=bioreactor metagenome TaxID=1076179 RepID=A0A644ZEE6_9ZZZZ
MPAFWRCGGCTVAGNHPKACPLGLARQAILESQRGQNLAALCAGVSPIGIDLFACVALIEHIVEVMPVVLICRAHGNAPDEAVFVIDAHAELVAKGALAVLLGVAQAPGAH